jgi:hypothetical protein
VARLSYLRESSIQLEKFLISGGVGHEIKGSQQNLIRCINVVLGELHLEQRLEHLIWELLSCLIVLGHPLHDGLVPHPVLKHLGGQFDEVSLYTRDRETSIVCLIAHVVHDVAKLMEKCYNVIMAQQRWLLFRWLSKVGDHGHHWKIDLILNSGSGHDARHLSMTLLESSGV